MILHSPNILSPSEGRVMMDRLFTPKSLLRCLAVLCFLIVLVAGGTASASEADLAIPDLHQGKFNIFGTEITAWNLLAGGALVICGTLGISLYQFYQIKKQPAHKSMLNVAEIIFQTCKTYLIQQGKFLLMLFVLIGAAISYYLWISHEPPKPGEPEGLSAGVTIALVLFFAIVGMAGSYAVAWYCLRVTIYA